GDLKEFLRLYQEHTESLFVEVYDPTFDAAAARSFGQSILPGDAFITVYENGVQTRRERFSLQVNDGRRENRLSNALLKASAGSSDKIYFTTGKGERALTENP